MAKQIKKQKQGEDCLCSVTNRNIDNTVENDEWMSPTTGENDKIGNVKNKMGITFMLDELVNYLKFLKVQVKTLESLGNKVVNMQINSMMPLASLHPGEMNNTGEITANRFQFRESKATTLYHLYAVSLSPTTLD